MLRRDEQDVARDASGWERRVLSPVLPGVEFEFMRATIGAGVDAGVFQPHGPGSREYLAVEAGTLRLSLDGDEVELHAGDSVFYAGDCHHEPNTPPGASCIGVHIQRQTNMRRRRGGATTSLRVGRAGRTDARHVPARPAVDALRKFGHERS
ncbi:cupin domain-containing protein [Actinomycetes bacterium KLBMP 9797]